MTRSPLLALFLLALLALAACGGADDAHPDDYADDMMYPEPPLPGDPFAEPAGTRGRQVAAANPDGEAQQVVIMDHGLQMARGAQLIPADWRLTQDIATDPTTGQLARYTLDVRGPRGELIRGLGVTNYGSMFGTSFHQAWHRVAMRGIQGAASNIAFGNLQRSAVLETLPAFQQAVQAGRQAGARLEGLEAPFRGDAGGQPMQGVVYLMHWSSPQAPDFGVVQVSLVLSPADLLAETLRLNEQMAASYRPNPAYEHRVRQISQAAMQQQQAQSQQWMANGQAQHQQRMASNQAQFDAHQQRMQTLSGIQDQQFQSWQNTQRSSDEMQRRTVNGINGTVDLYDAQAGQTIYGAESGYNTYWTDPSGNVVGSQGYDNPDVWQYNQATDLDDVYDARSGNDGW